jgi:hypothetical protein
MRQPLPCLCVLLAVLALAAAGGPRVAFDEDGTALVNGKPFFPIGLFTYSLDDPTVAEIRKQGFNTVSPLTEHHQPIQLDWVQKEGWMAVCPPEEQWVRVGTNHPALLAWYASVPSRSFRPKRCEDCLIITL